MKIMWIVPLLFIQSYHTINSQLRDEYNQYSFYQKRPLSPRPLDAMADSTNDLGVCVLRIIAAGGAIGNIAFSPFGLMAVSVLLYEGSSGYSALQIKQSLNLPWEILAVRIGVRDLNRYLKTYFKSDGFLNGLTMSREEICLRPQFKQVLRLYGFDDPNSFLIDSCRQNTATMTTVKPTQPMSVTTHGTVVAEMTPTSQMIQVSTNLTNASVATTDRPAKVTDATDAVFTVDKNTNSPMNSGTDTMAVDIETEPNVMPVEPLSTGGTEAAPDGESNGSTAAADDVAGASATTPIGSTVADPVTTPTDSQTDQTIGATADGRGSHAAETSTEGVHGTAATTVGPAAATFASSSDGPFVTQGDAVVDARIGADGDKYNEAFVVGGRTTTAEPGNAATATVDDGTAGTTVRVAADTAVGSATTPSAEDADRTTAAITTSGPDDGTTMSDVVEYVTTGRLSDAAENEIVNGAESNRHYRVAYLENKSARSMPSADGLPTFNVEFVVTKEDLRPGCNRTRKKTIIKPDRVLMEYPKNSGVSITLRKSEKRRRRRHLEQYYRYNENRNQWYDDYKHYDHSPGWMDRSSNLFESTNVFNYRRIPFFTYTAVLPFGFVYELKSQVIEIPLDDPKYTLMILMPNHQDGLSELLLLLPTIPLRHIHNSLKPIAVHVTIPTFKYTAKVDLTSALQQIGIRDVFYRYRADLSFMSPDARLFVSSVQQVVSVTAKKYNTPPVYEIQRKYVERDFVVSRPFVYFVMDIHTKVSLIAGVITDPLASPIWV